MANSLLIRFAGVTIEVRATFNMVISPDMEKFIIKSGDPDEIITISSLPCPLATTQPSVFSSSTLRVCREVEGWCHIFPGLKGDDNTLCAFHWHSDHKHLLYAPEPISSLLESTGKFAAYIAPELLLLSHDRFFLHSSLVLVNGRAVLFCGPSGIGKSTQAALWQDHLGAKILNGDRAVIYQRDHVFWASGSPYSGSSGIYCQEEAPIAAIVLLGQGHEEIIRPASVKEAFATFCRETVQHSWDETYTNKLIRLLAQLAESVPVYHFSCRPVPEAASLAYNSIFTRSFTL